MATFADDRFQRLDAAFDAVLDQPVGEQFAFVDQVANDDPDLRTELLELLRAHHRAGILDEVISPISPLHARTTPEFDAPSMSRVGPFRIERAIGEGGMGQVFLGVRDDENFTQRVAIKIMRQQSSDMGRRFLEERRIVASLEHRHIARLIDGGITVDGMPYFAMEFVDGEPIDRYCATRHLSIDERLSLFAQVCEAVSYAHQHLVIHRDLKPSNILVTAEGEVKLLDFGIAKLLDSVDGDVRLDLTSTGIRVMTPEVAAPEQFRGEAVSTATDVYALGMLLYRLLTNAAPYELKGRSLAEMERIVCEIDPPVPSTKAHEIDRRRVAGDLDLIVMTALQKQSSRRYQSADALAAEVRRFREGRAILARPDTITYRTAKFLVRHRTAVALFGMAIVLAILGGARERVIRKRAEVEARKATEVQKFLMSVFEVTNPYAWDEEDRGKMSARELLDRGARRIDSTLVAEPEVQAELRTTMGRVYASLGLANKAAPMLRQALDQRVRLYGDRDTSVASTMDALGAVLIDLNKLDTAESLLTKALAIRRSRLSARDTAVAATVTHLATLYEERGSLARAESLHAEALAMNQASSGGSSMQAASGMNNLALVYYREGQFARAESLYRKALALQISVLGERHASTAATMHNLAQSLDALGNLDEAEQYYRRSLDAKRAVLGNAHPSVTIGMNNLGLFLATERGRLDEAETMTREALRLDQQMFGPRHTYVAEGLRNLGIIMRNDGKFVQSDSAIRAALDIDRALIGEHGDKMGMLYGQLASTRYQMGDSLEAVRLTRESLSRYREIVGPSHPNTITMTTSLARILAEVGRNAEADSLARIALAGLDSTKDNDISQYVATQRVLGAALIGEGRVDDALPILERALDKARKQFGDSNLRTTHIKLTYAVALVAKGRLDEAKPIARSVYAVLEPLQRTQPRLFAQARTLLARADR